MHHEGDLLLQAPDAATSVKSAAQEVILRSPADGTAQHRRWIQAKAAQLLAGADVTTEPDLIVWGRRLGPASTHPVPELQAALKELETWPGQKTRARRHPARPGLGLDLHR